MINRLLCWIKSAGTKKKKEDQRLLLAFAEKLRFIIDNRAMAKTTMKLSASLVAGIEKNKSDPTACDLCLVIGELEKHRVDFVTLAMAYRCLREAVGKNNIGDKSKLVTKFSQEALRKAAEELVAKEDTSIESAAHESGVVVKELSFSEFDMAMKAANDGGDRADVSLSSKIVE